MIYRWKDSACLDPKVRQTHTNTDPACPGWAYPSPETPGNGVNKSKRSHGPSPGADQWDGSRGSNSRLDPHQEEPRLDPSMFIQQINERLVHARHCSGCWRFIQQETKSLFTRNLQARPLDSVLSHLGGFQREKGSDWICILKGTSGCYWRNGKDAEVSGWEAMAAWPQGWQRRW